MTIPEALVRCIEIGRKWAFSEDTQMAQARIDDFHALALVLQIELSQRGVTSDEAGGNIVARLACAYLMGREDARKDNPFAKMVVAEEKPE